VTVDGNRPSPTPASSRLRRAEALAAVGFLLPNVIGFLVFTLLPVIAAFALSLTDYDLSRLSTGAHFVGLRNFVQLLGFHSESGGLVPNDREFWQYLGNTLFLMLGLPLNIIGAFLLALLLNRRLRGVTLFRTIYFLPTVASAVAVCVLWRWIFHYQPDQIGLLDSLLLRLGLSHPPAWLDSRLWAKPAFIIMGLWTGLGGYNCILFLAGLQNIPEELYEAAELDGAGAWARLRHITWPLLTPTTFFIITMSIIAGFQGGFVAAYLMTGGGPAGATTTLMLYIYNHAFAWKQMGYAAAVAVVLFGLVFGFTLVHWRLGRRVVFQ